MPNIQIYMVVAVINTFYILTLKKYIKYIRTVDITLVFHYLHITMPAEGVCVCVSQIIT